MGKSTSFNDATKSEFSRMEQLLIQTANDAAQCLKMLKSNLADYDTRHGLLFLNTAKSFMRADIRAAKDLASELHHVADQIAKCDPPSETEIAAARDKVNAVSDAMIDLKKRARSYDRKTGADDILLERYKDAVAEINRVETILADSEFWTNARTVLRLG